MGMSSVAGIWLDYLDSLRSARDGKLKPRAVLGQIGIPLAVGVAAALLRFGVSNAGDIVTGVSIVAALMCGVATLLFQTRVDLRERVCGADDHFLNKGDLKLVDELFAQVMWSILSGFLLVFLLLMKSALAGLLGEFDLLVRAGYGVIWCLVANFVLTVGMVLKRMRRVYQIAGQGKR